MDAVSYLRAFYKLFRLADLFLPKAFLSRNTVPFRNLPRMLDNLNLYRALSILVVHNYRIPIHNQLLPTLQPWNRKPKDKVIGDADKTAAQADSWHNEPVHTSSVVGK
jgi:hypothetical protein